MAKLNIEDVKAFVRDNSNSKLSSIKYEGTKRPLDFICDCGNSFTTTFEKFKLRNKRQCNSCGFKLRNKNKIIKFNEIKHFIDVESGSGCTLLSKNVEGLHGEVHILCPCGNDFKTKFKYFKTDNKRTCDECTRNSRSYYRQHTIEDVQRFVHENSNCLLLSDVYKNNKNHMQFICSCGNPFSTSFEIFKDYNKRTCNICTNTKISKERSLSIDFIKNFIESDSKSGCKLLSATYINNSTPLNIACYCGEKFVTDFAHFNHSYKRKCNKCSKYYSKAEIIIIEYLERNNIEYIKDYSFEDLRHELPLKFDFAIFDKNGDLYTLIEYDGIQHYEPVKVFGGEEGFRLSKHRDGLKDQYSCKNKISLLRIPYWNFEFIEEILKESLNQLNQDNTEPSLI